MNSTAKGEKIIIGGDFNTCHQYIDLRNPKANEGNTGFLPEEREWIDIYLEHDFVDIFRDLYPEKEQYSWWTYRGMPGRGMWAGDWIIS